MGTPIFSLPSSVLGFRQQINKTQAVLILSEVVAELCLGSASCFASVLVLCETCILGWFVRELSLFGCFTPLWACVNQLAAQWDSGKIKILCLSMSIITRMNLTDLHKIWALQQHGWSGSLLWKWWWKVRTGVKQHITTLVLSHEFKAIKFWADLCENYIWINLSLSHIHAHSCECTHAYTQYKNASPRIRWPPLCHHSPQSWPRLPKFCPHYIQQSASRI